MTIGRPKSLIKRTKSSVYLKDDSLQQVSKIAKLKKATKNAIFQEAIDLYLSQNPSFQINELTGS